MVNPDGSMIVASGRQPTIARTAAGRYSFSLTGMGTAICPVPALTAVATSTTIRFDGGTCNAGAITTTVLTGDGADHTWSYVVVGTNTGAAPSAARGGNIDLPGGGD
jgi:hypothetical protein